MHHAIRSGRNGFTLVEVLVALTLLATGLVGLAAIGASSLRRLTLANAHDTAARLASGRVQQLLALPCGAVVNGSHGGTFAEEWSTATTGARRAFMVRVRFSLGGVPREVNVDGELPC